MSIRTKCSSAARLLLESPSLRVITEGPEGIFTELDVIFLAAREEQWADSEVRENWMAAAQREAAEALSWFYRDSQAVRFGPVQPSENEDSDYVRVASKIVYAPAEGIKSIKTPNGTFGRMFHKDDVIRRPGRRAVVTIARDDLEPWDSTVNINSADRREIARLKAELAAYQARVRELEQENQRLRQRAAPVKEKAA